MFCTYFFLDCLLVVHFRPSPVFNISLLIISSLPISRFTHSWQAPIHPLPCTYQSLHIIATNFFKFFPREVGLDSAYPRYRRSRYLAPVLFLPISVTSYADVPSTWESSKVFSGEKTADIWSPRKCCVSRTARRIVYYRYSIFLSESALRRLPYSKYSGVIYYEV